MIFGSILAVGTFVALALWSTRAAASPADDSTLPAPAAIAR